MGKERRVCTRGRIVYGIVTVSEKGQIAIPVDARRDLDIKTGDKLIVLKRKDEAGLTLIKLDKMDELMLLLQEDEEFFKKLKEVGKMSKKYTCKDCRHYRPIDETKGDCFGHEVPADMPAEQCPAKAFEPKEEK